MHTILLHDCSEKPEMNTTWHANKQVETCTTNNGKGAWVERNENSQKKYKHIEIEVELILNTPTNMGGQHSSRNITLNHKSLMQLSHTRCV